MEREGLVVIIMVKKWRGTILLIFTWSNLPSLTEGKRSRDNRSFQCLKTVTTGQQWCISNGWELVELQPHQPQPDPEEDDFRESWGFKRICQALHACTWSNLTMKGILLYIYGTSIYSYVLFSFLYFLFTDVLPTSQL